MWRIMSGIQCGGVCEVEVSLTVLVFYNSQTNQPAGRSAGQPAIASYGDGLRHLKITRLQLAAIDYYNISILFEHLYLL